MSQRQKTRGHLRKSPLAWTSPDRSDRYVRCGRMPFTKADPHLSERGGAFRPKRASGESPPRKLWAQFLRTRRACVTSYSNRVMDPSLIRSTAAPITWIGTRNNSRLHGIAESVGDRNVDLGRAEGAVVEPFQLCPVNIEKVIFGDDLDLRHEEGGCRRASATRLSILMLVTPILCNEVPAPGNVEVVRLAAQDETVVDRRRGRKRVRIERHKQFARLVERAHAVEPNGIDPLEYVAILAMLRRAVVLFAETDDILEPCDDPFFAQRIGWRLDRRDVDAER
ncbi:hypothetical protein [Croceicoccus sp. YJ47]|uniref:hypothetical protein n=1 Tax=Croceicoccus sp. YJ47 TaxID=2798724 RepID=UPI0019245480|nr:hypothetical protein [Croceicoccus sp. YJ47]QQN73381.1 hypothetical protein JD971_11120 [Croceicoccus sp. YJ47]